MGNLNFLFCEAFSNFKKNKKIDFKYKFLTNRTKYDIYLTNRTKYDSIIFSRGGQTDFVELWRSRMKSTNANQIVGAIDVFIHTQHTVQYT